MRGFRLIAVLAVLAASVAAAAQMRNPPPASIYSVGGSQLGPPPASIYSLPPQNFGFGFPCCAPGRVPLNPGARLANPPRAHHRSGHRGSNTVFVPIYAYPYYPYYAVEVEPPSEGLPGGGTFYRPQGTEPETEPAAPTVFERRPAREAAPREAPKEASRYETPERAESPAPASSPTPSVPEPEESITTLLVFLDGHSQEVHNYAIMGKTLFLFSGERRKIPLSELDLEATVRANDDRGVEFRIPNGE